MKWAIMSIIIKKMEIISNQKNVKKSITTDDIFLNSFWITIFNKKKKAIWSFQAFF